MHCIQNILWYFCPPSTRVRWCMLMMSSIQPTHVTNALHASMYIEANGTLILSQGVLKSAFIPYKELIITSVSNMDRWCSSIPLIDIRKGSIIVWFKTFNAYSTIISMFSHVESLLHHSAYHACRLIVISITVTHKTIPCKHRRECNVWVRMSHTLRNMDRNIPRDIINVKLLLTNLY